MSYFLFFTVLTLSLAGAPSAQAQRHKYSKKQLREMKSRMSCPSPKKHNTKKSPKLGSSSGQKPRPSTPPEVHACVAMMRSDLTEFEAIDLTDNFRENNCCEYYQRVVNDYKHRVNKTALKVEVESLGKSLTILKSSQMDKIKAETQLVTNKNIGSSGNGVKDAVAKLEMMGCIERCSLSMDKEEVIPNIPIPENRHITYQGITREDLGIKGNVPDKKFYSSSLRLVSSEGESCAAPEMPYEVIDSPFERELDYKAAVEKMKVDGVFTYNLKDLKTIIMPGLAKNKLSFDDVCPDVDKVFKSYNSNNPPDGTPGHAHMLAYILAKSAGNSEKEIDSKIWFACPKGKKASNGAEYGSRFLNCEYPNLISSVKKEDLEAVYDIQGKEPAQALRDLCKGQDYKTVSAPQNAPMQEFSFKFDTTCEGTSDEVVVLEGDDIQQQAIIKELIGSKSKSGNSGPSGAVAQ
jgi:hypothetical protein